MPQDNLFKSLTKEKWQRDWWFILFAKILVGIFLPFFSDEAYYWVWTHNLKLSYFDHPPFISWLFLVGKPFENFFFAARLPTVILGHLTIWIWCQYIAKSFASDEKRRLFWLLTFHTLIGFGSLVSNPDVPFLFFWSLSVWFYTQSIELTDSKKWPALLGVSLGLGFTSKYLVALFAPVAILHLVLSGNWKSLRWKHIVLPVFLGALFSSPVWIWNFQNDWQSFKFQFDHGLGKPWKPQWTADFILGTVILLFPPFVFKFFKDKLFLKYKDLHIVLFLSLLGFFIYTTFGGDTELNWPLALYPSFFFALVQLLKNSKLYIGYCYFFGVLGNLLIALALLNPAKNLHPRLNEGALYKKLQNDTKDYSPLYTSTYQSASYFWFLTKTPYYKLRYASRPDEYDSMAGSLPQEKIFYFLKEQYQTIPSQHLDSYDFVKVADLDYKFEVYKATKKE